KIVSLDLFCKYSYLLILGLNAHIVLYSQYLHIDVFFVLSYIGFISISPLNISFAICFIILLIVFCKLVNCSLVTVLDLFLLMFPSLSKYTGTILDAPFSNFLS